MEIWTIWQGKLLILEKSLELQLLISYVWKPFKSKAKVKPNWKSDLNKKWLKWNTTQSYQQWDNNSLFHKDFLKGVINFLWLQKKFLLNSFWVVKLYKKAWLHEADIFKWIYHNQSLFGSFHNMSNENLTLRFNSFISEAVII